MQIVIDIDSYVLEHCKRHVKEHYANNIEEAIANGIQLPKGHGRLVDEKDVIDIYDNDDRLWWGNAIDDIKEFVPTIVEADKESEDVE